MNIISIIIVLVVAVAFVWAVRMAFFTRTGRRGSHCGNCSDQSCPHRHTSSHCHG